MRKVDFQPIVAMVQHTTTKEFTLKLSETLNQTTQVSNGWQLAFAFLALLVYL